MMRRYVVNGLSKRLRQAVADSYLSLEDIRIRTGISRSCLWYYLTNEKNPSIYSLTQLAKVLNVSTDWLLGLKEDRK
jgi:transcriptional regulator with XRE-family HTH domain